MFLFCLPFFVYVEEYANTIIATVKGQQRLLSFKVAHRLEEKEKRKNQIKKAQCGFKNEPSSITY